MAKKGPKQDDRIAEIKERYKEADNGWRDIYEEAEKDLAFVYDVGDGQWPTDVRTAREKDNRPIITVNKLQKFVRQLRGDMMTNRPRIKVIPVDDKADVNMAELYNGLIRQIEYLSNAPVAYDTGYMHAVSGGVGFFRIITKYESEDSFNQDIQIKRVMNPFSVRFDPLAEEFTMDDARFCFIEDMLRTKDFKKLYPKAEVSNFEGAEKELFGEWIINDKVRVAEYFYKQETKKKIALLQTGETVVLEGSMTPEYIMANGGEIIRERTASFETVKWCKMTGAEILEESDWPGKYIPVIPVFGDEIVVDGRRYYLSMTRGARGPQEMYNYWATAATENVALSPKMPYMVDHRQIQGFEHEWEEANIKNRMFIRYKAIPGLQKPSRETQTQVPNAIMSMLQQTAFDIEDHLGHYEASKGQASNERSGKAILARVAQSDKGTYTFVDNLSRAIVAAGRQLIDLIPKIYDTPRALQIMGEDGNQQVVKVNQPTGTDSDGNVMVENDLSVGKYDLVAIAGASFSSKRQEMVEFLVQTLQYAPQLAAIIAPLTIKYSDYPGAQELYAELTKAMQQAGAQNEVA